MGRYSTAWNANVADSIARRNRGRARGRWRKKSTASKALHLARKAVASLPKREYYTDWYRRPWQLVTYGPAAASNHHKFWALTSWHPYADRDMYWQSAATPVVSQGLYFLRYRFPRLAVPAAHVDPSSTSGILAYQQTLVPSTTVLTIDRGVNPDDVRNEYKFHHFSVYGPVVMALNDDANRAGYVQTNPKLVPAPGLTNGSDTRIFLRMVFAQQFKEFSDEPDLRPTQIFRQPIDTDNDIANDSNDFRMRWLDTKLLAHKPDGNDNIVYDDAFEVGNNTTPTAPNDPGTRGVIGARGTAKFRVISVNQWEFTSSSLDTRRLRSIFIRDKNGGPIELKPADPVMRYDYGNDATVDSTDPHAKCLNPCFLWFFFSKGSNNDPVANTNQPYLYEMLNISARYSDV